MHYRGSGSWCNVPKLGISWAESLSSETWKNIGTSEGVEYCQCYNDIQAKYRKIGKARTTPNFPEVSERLFSLKTKTVLYDTSKYDTALGANLLLPSCKGPLFLFNKLKCGLPFPVFFNIFFIFTWRYSASGLLTYLSPSDIASGFSNITEEYFKSEIMLRLLSDSNPTGYLTILSSSWVTKTFRLSLWTDHLTN